MAESKPISVMQFRDFREYLKVVGEQYVSRRHRPLRLTHWAKRLGYRSPRSIAMVLNGQRLPSAEMLHRLSRDLGHSDTEHRYFALLVQKERRQRRKSGDTLVCEELERMRPDGADEVCLDSNTFAYIAEWYHLAIKQLAEAPRFQEDPAWIRHRLRNKVTIAEVKDALQTLEELGILARDKAGRLRSTGKKLTTLADVAATVVQSHHRQMMERAIEALTEQNVACREMDSKTFRLDPKDLPEAKQALRRFRDEFLSRFEKRGAGHVYQLNFQLFEHTLTEGEGNEARS